MNKINIKITEEQIQAAKNLLQDLIKQYLPGDHSVLSIEHHNHYGRHYALVKFNIHSDVLDGTNPVWKLLQDASKAGFEFGMYSEFDREGYMQRFLWYPCAPEQKKIRVHEIIDGAHISMEDMINSEVVDFSSSTHEDGSGYIKIEVLLKKVA